MSKPVISVEHLTKRYELGIIKNNRNKTVLLPNQ